MGFTGAEEARNPDAHLVGDLGFVGVFDDVEVVREEGSEMLVQLMGDELFGLNGRNHLYRIFDA